LSLPPSVRTHQIARYWFCAEQSRLLAVLGLKIPDSPILNQGTKVHDWTEERPKSNAEYALFCKLDKTLSRNLDGIDIIAHPDDLFVLGKNTVQLVEYKTIDKMNVKMWKSSLAKYQLQIYCWVLEPILKQLGYRMAHHHYVVYLSRQGQFIKKVMVEQDNRCTEAMIRQVLAFWKTGQPLIPPMKWKCTMCSANFKQECRVYRGCS
jgi:CRISPR/Cas system-associated exonuclease Cas4 (RecB family)